MKPGTILSVYLTLFIICFLWERLLALLNIRHLQSQKDTIPEAFKKYIDRETYVRSIEYNQTVNRFSFISDTASTIFVLIIILCGILGMLDAWIQSFTLPSYLKSIIYIYSISLIFSLFSLPFSLYSQFVIEERFGFNRMTIRLFFLDMVKSLLISLILLTPILYMLFWFIEKAGSLWWIWAFLLISLFQLLLSVLYPLVIAPLFNKFKPLGEGSLKDRLVDLSDQLKFAIKGIFIVDGSKRSRHSNAYFTGLGRAKRIVLFDTLIEGFEDDQIAAVLSHEIGHEKKHHLLKRIVLSFLLSFIGLWLISLILTWQPLYTAFGFNSSSAHAAVVLLLFFSHPLTFLFKPLFSIWSRKHEREADRFAVKALKTCKDLKSALLTLGKDNLTNLTPHPWYSFYHYSHPTLLERIKAFESQKFLC